MGEGPGLTLFGREHYDLMTSFDQAFRGRRLDKEDKALWPKGNVYASGETNELFLAYRRGYALGRATAGSQP